VPSGHHNSFWKTQNRKTEKLIRDSEKLHTEHKCVPRSRLTSLPKLKRDSVVRRVDETPYIKGRRMIKGCGL
jgi:hypothetical protein